jgi:hypothetical protein
MQNKNSLCEVYISNKDNLNLCVYINYCVYEKKEKRKHPKSKDNVSSDTSNKVLEIDWMTLSFLSLDEY